MTDEYPNEVQATEQQNSTTAAGSRIVLQQQLTLQTVTDLQSYY